MSAEWLDNLESKKRLKESAETLRSNNLKHNQDKIRQSNLNKRIRRICSEVNNKAGLKLTFQSISSSQQYINVEGPGDPSHFFRITASENGVILEFGTTLSKWLREQLSDEGWMNLQQMRDAFDCEIMIVPSAFSDDDIYDCLRYLHQESEKPRVIKNALKQDDAGIGFVSSLLVALKKFFGASST
jgi:hypothetical protein